MCSSFIVRGCHTVEPPAFVPAPWRAEPIRLGIGIVLDCSSFSFTIGSATTQSGI